MIWWFNSQIQIESKNQSACAPLLTEHFCATSIPGVDVRHWIAPSAGDRSLQTLRTVSTLNAFRGRGRGCGLGEVAAESRGSGFARLVCASTTPLQVRFDVDAASSRLEWASSQDRLSHWIFSGWIRFGFDRTKENHFSSPCNQPILSEVTLDLQTNVLKWDLYLWYWYPGLGGQETASISEYCTTNFCWFLNFADSFHLFWFLFQSVSVFLANGDTASSFSFYRALLDFFPQVSCKVVGTFANETWKTVPHRNPVLLTFLWTRIARIVFAPQGFSPLKWDREELVGEQSKHIGIGIGTANLLDRWKKSKEVSGSETILCLRLRRP